MVARSQDIRSRLAAALDAASAEELLALTEREAVAIGALHVELDQGGRGVLKAIWDYCGRWRAEGGPHAREENRERVFSMADRMPRFSLDPPAPRYKIRVRPALLSWDDTRTKHFRGMLIQVLRQAPQPVRSAASTPPKGERTRAPQVEAREQDVLRALPRPDGTPLKSQAELVKRLARTVSSGGWSQPTISRTLANLRTRGLVEEKRLRRTPRGDKDAS